MPMASEDTLELASAGGMYRLLARLWLFEADRALLETLRLPPYQEHFGPAVAEATVEDLAVDYCQLFLGPQGHLPPMQSVWQEDRFQGALTSSLQGFVEIVGFQASELRSGTMLDHLGVELSMMGQIVTAAAEEMDATRRGEIESLGAAFFARHLTWPQPLLDAAARQAQTAFYRTVVSLTDTFLAAERQIWTPA